MKRTLAMELVRLDQLETAFIVKALRDQDVPAGILMVKIGERRATLLGLNPPQGRQSRSSSEPAKKLTSLEEARVRLDEFMGIASPN